MSSMKLVYITYMYYHVFDQFLRHLIWQLDNKLKIFLFLQSINEQPYEKIIMDHLQLINEEQRLINHLEYILLLIIFLLNEPAFPDSLGSVTIYEQYNYVHDTSVQSCDVNRIYSTCR